MKIKNEKEILKRMEQDFCKKYKEHLAKEEELQEKLDRLCNPKPLDAIVRNPIELNAAYKALQNEKETTSMYARLALDHILKNRDSDK